MHSPLMPLSSRSELVRRNPHSACAEHAFAGSTAGAAVSQTSDHLIYGFIAWPVPRPTRLSRCIAATASPLVPPDSLRLGVPTTPANLRSRGHPCDLAAARQPTGFTSPGSSRVASLPAISQTGSSMGTTTFRGFSPLTAARPSRIALSSMPFPTLRCRSSEDFSLQADAFTDAGVIHTVARPLLSWLFPPFEDDLPASPSHFCAGSSLGL